MAVPDLVLGLGQVAGADLGGALQVGDGPGHAQDAVVRPRRQAEVFHRRLQQSLALGVEGAVAGYPFPIPKTGQEVMWNHLLRYSGVGYDGIKYENWNVDSAGVPTLSTSGELWWAWPIYDPKKTGAISPTEPYWQAKVMYTGPLRRAGEGLMLWDAVNPMKQARKAWQ